MAHKSARCSRCRPRGTASLADVHTYSHTQTVHALELCEAGNESASRALARLTPTDLFSSRRMSIPRVVPAHLSTMSILVPVPTRDVIEYPASLWRVASFSTVFYLGVVLFFNKSIWFLFFGFKCVGLVWFALCGFQVVLRTLTSVYLVIMLRMYRFYVKFSGVQVRLSQICAAILPCQDIFFISWIVKHAKLEVWYPVARPVAPIRLVWKWDFSLEKGERKKKPKPFWRRFALSISFRVEMSHSLCV